MTERLEGFQRDLDAFFTQHTEITPSDVYELEVLLTRQRVFEALEELVDDEEALEPIARRSYIHSQGFRKIILIDGRDQLGYKLRLHTWPFNKARQEGAPLAEMKHEHRWNFVSRVLAGELEDHWYSICELDTKELEICEKFESAMERIPYERIQEVCGRIDALESSKLTEEAKLVRLSGGKEHLVTKANKGDLLNLLGLTEDELNTVVHILAKYTNERTAEGEIYTPAGPRIFKPEDILIHRQDEFRFHPIDKAHRLIIDPTEYSATAVVTGPVHQGRKPGEFVRTRKGRPENDIRLRQYFTVDSLKTDIKEVLSHIAP